MPQLTFYPLGNADCCLIRLAGEERLLFDYANTRDPKDAKDLRCDLPTELREDLDAAGRDYYDVVAFTHLDEDHYKRATEFFWLRHAKKYQGEDRIKINTMWVPAAVITEDNLDKEEARVIQAEARYRFRAKTGIRVFSRPDRLRKWCERNGISLEERRPLITDAGQVVPEFSTEADGVEFFVHSPFAKRLNEREVEDRNDDSLVVQATFTVSGVETKALLMADVTHEMLSDIVDITKGKGREKRLEWDVVKLPHHCSYLSLGPEKGEDKTEPTPQVKWLYEVQQQDGGVIISTSEQIPMKGTKEDEDCYPPHRQSANYYKGIVDQPADRFFLVTMEQPTKTSPRPIIIDIDASKATVRRRAAIAAAVAASSRPPRAG